MILIILILPIHPLWTSLKQILFQSMKWNGIEGKGGRGEEELVEAGEAYILQQWPEATFDSTLSTGEAKTPYNGTSWLAVWPKRFCRYEPWEEVKAELLAAIDADVKMQEGSLQDVYFYITPENDENWVTVYLLR